MKNKVLLVSPYSKKKVGGIGTWTKIILDHQAKYSHFDLFFLNTAFCFKSNIVNNEVLRVITGVIDSILILILLFVKIIQHRPKTIHYTSSASYALIKDLVAIYIAKIFKIKFIIHWHFGRIPELFEKKNMEWKILKTVARAANASIVVDNNSLVCFSRNQILNGVFIPNPISEFLHEKAKSVNFNIKILDIGILVFVGHIIPAKGVFELVEACCKLEDVKQLILIGPVCDDVKNDLISIASKRNNGNWLQWKGEIPREDVLQYLNSANALCLPSYTEGFPYVVLEAMAVGCPVIATKVGAIEEIVASKDFGDAGVCIEPKNVNQLVEALVEIISNSEKTRDYGKNGNQRVLSKYSVDKIFHQYENLW
jgi:glycosyltransferase involved in cell wall biosynthesis